MKSKSIVKINMQLCQSEDTAFGTKMRQELLRGLMFGTAALTILVLIVLTAVVLLTDLPVTIIVLIYLALIIVSWQHGCEDYCRCLGETQDPQMCKLQSSYTKIWAVVQPNIRSAFLVKISPRHLVTPWV